MGHFDLASITMNHGVEPPRVVIYGEHGMGKTTFGTSAPKPIVVRTEDGLGVIQAAKFPLAKSYGDAISAIGTLYKGGHPFQTCVVDTLDWLEPLIWAHVAMLQGKDSIEDIGYGKGYIFADEYWREFLAGLTALRDNGMVVICLAHAQIKRFDAPDTDPYDRYQLKLHPRAAGIVQEWADVVGFVHHEVHTVSKDVGFNKEKVRGIGVGRRLLSVEERPAYYAKNRYSLPPQLDFPQRGAWDVFAAACAPAYALPEPEPLNLVLPELVEPAPVAQVDLEQEILNEVREESAEGTALARSHTE